MVLFHCRVGAEGNWLSYASLKRDLLELKMDSEDLLTLPDSGKSVIESESNELSFADSESGAAASLPSNSEADKDQMNENFMQNGSVVGEENKDRELIVSTAAVQISVELAEKFDNQEKVHSISSVAHIENGCQTIEDRSPLANLKKEESSISNQDKKSNCILFFKSNSILISVHAKYLRINFLSTTG